MVTVQIRFSSKRPLVDVQTVRDVEEVVCREVGQVRTELREMHAALAEVRLDMWEHHRDQTAARSSDGFSTLALAAVGLVVAFTALGAGAETLADSVPFFVLAVVMLGLGLVMARRAFPPRSKPRWWRRPKERT